MSWPIRLGLTLVLWTGAAVSTASGQAPTSANPQTPPTETRILFSQAFKERTTTDSIIIQTGEDAVLVFDAPGPFTLFDPTSKNAKNLIIIAKHAIIESPTVVQSFDPSDSAERPLQIPDMAAAGNGGDGGDADHCQRGGDATPGLPGKDGSPGSPGLNAPLIILDISKLDGSQTITFSDRGGDGGQGQNGQRGGDGGRGGRGGDGVDHLTGCACGPGEAGTPAAAGDGGRGGPGGPGGRGGTILLSPSIQSDTGGLLKLVVTTGDPGENGNGGTGGKGGKGNQGGGGSTYCTANNISSQDMPNKDNQINTGKQDPLPVNPDGIVKTLKVSAWK